MTLEQLRIFIAVAERQHMTRAAESLHLTQSAVSAAIAALEARHDVRLFHRVGRGIELTEAGRAFLGDARAVLDRAAVAEQALADRGTLIRGRLALVASQTIQNRLRGQRLRIPEDQTQVFQQAHTKAFRTATAGIADCDAGCTCALRPISTGRVSHGKQRFPDFRRAIRNTGGQRRPCGASSLANIVRPYRKTVAQCMAFSFMFASTVRLDMFMRSPATHADDHAARHHRIGKVAKSGERNCGKYVEVLNRMCWSNAAWNGCASLVPRIQQRPQVFVLVILTALSEDGIHLVEQQRCLRIRHRSENRCDTG